MKAIEVGVIITGVRSRGNGKYGELGLTMVTPELSPEDKVEIMNIQGVSLMALFTPLDEKNAPKYKIDKELEQKTPSNRLRNALYVLWEQSGSKEEFDDFYKKQMERFIEVVKEKLS
jgi:hypothetical protein